MTVRITPGIARGGVTVPASKSAAHRTLILAALTPGVTTIDNLPDGDDVAATVACLCALGARIDVTDHTARVRGIQPIPRPEETRVRVLDCRESGSTLRFLLPTALLFGGTTVFRGSARLMARPMEDYERLCSEKGIGYRQGTDGITVRGVLPAGEYHVAGDVSSQFCTGLLLALPHTDGNSTLRLQTSLAGAPYVALTERTLLSFGYSFAAGYGCYSIPGNQTGAGGLHVTLPADQSSAAFFGALNVLGGQVKIPQEEGDRLQPDGVWRDLFPELAGGHPTVSVKDCPDLAPVLMATAAALHGVTLTDTARLRYKESDRGAAMAEELTKCGVTVTVDENRITVSGGATPPGEPLFGHNDHRVAMALGVLLSRVGGELCGAGCVTKSLPDFWRLAASIGVNVTEISD